MNATIAAVLSVGSIMIPALVAMLTIATVMERKFGP
jgi:hypothetical protein